MSGYKDYKDPGLVVYPRHKVRIIVATPENFAEYGNFVDNYDDEKVIIEPWNVSGWRSLMDGTGRDGGITEGEFDYWQDGLYYYAKNNAVGGDYVIARKNVDSETDLLDNGKRPNILTREANYHPDGGQVFYPLDKSPFVLMLALPGDDITLNSFIGFYFDGTKGCQIKPNIWHQPVFTLNKESKFMTKQGKVHACVGVDTIEEFGHWLELDLNII